MVQQYDILTPEAVNVTYRIAGIGTRFLAALVDTTILVIAFLVIIGGSIAVGTLGSVGRTAGAILALSLIFFLFWGYYIVFETLWSGQTPGKRKLKIRVIKTSGYPISFVDTVIRNLVRVVDFLPSLYGVGVLTMFISGQSRRLGDYAAGTIVVWERAATGMPEATAGPTPDSLQHGLVTPLGAIHHEELEWNMRAITSDDMAIIREYLERAPQLNPATRQSIGENIATHVASRIGVEPSGQPQAFLRRVLELVNAGE